MGTDSSLSLLKRFTKFKHRSLSNKTLIVLVVLLTLFRVWLAVKTPIDLRGERPNDDFLAARTGYSLSRLQWLGDYKGDTFSKGISFPIWLAVNHWLGIPFSLALILLHIFAIILLIYSLYKIVSKSFNTSIYIFVGMYVFALYNPISFDSSYAQMVYRNFYQVSLTCIVFACVLGAFAQRNEKGYLKWIIGLCISLPLFVTCKEDSDWIYLLIIPAFALIVIFLIIENKGFKRNFP